MTYVDFLELLGFVFQKNAEFPDKTGKHHMKKEYNILEKVRDKSLKEDINAYPPSII